MVADGCGDLTPEYLTERLRVSGTLPAGRVTAIQAGESRKTILSTITSYRVEYSADAPPDAPTRMIFKGSGSGIDPILRRASELEVAFYRQAAPLTPAGLLPRCYDAEVTESGVRVLLEDLSDTHRIVTTWPLPPGVEVCERIVDTWAAFHGFWWRHPSLGHGVGIFLDEAALAAFGVERRQRYARFAEALGDGLPTRAQDLYDRLLDTLDRVARRPSSTRTAPSSAAMRTCGPCSIRATVSPPASGSSTGRTGGWGAAPTTLPTWSPCTGIRNAGPASRRRSCTASTPGCARAASRGTAASSCSATTGKPFSSR